MMTSRNTQVLLFTFILVGLSLAYSNFPRPKIMDKGGHTVWINPETFKVQTNSNSQILARGIQRYQEKLFFPFESKPPPDTAPVLIAMLIVVKNNSEVLQLGVDESYSITIMQEYTYQVEVEAESIWGALRALETFSQLIDYDYEQFNYALNCIPVYINDSPRYPWRGLMIDTARHYLPPKTIMRTIDAMSYSKLNTLHWHLTDAESFPLIVPAYANLSKYGSWAPGAVYSKNFITTVVNYAKDRGIRVITETDMPGHAYSWGLYYPITVECALWEQQKSWIPMNPTLNQTYEIINAVLEEIISATEDNVIHLGGDEARYDCWLADKNIVAWMKDNNMTNVDELVQYFYDQVRTGISNSGRTTLYWEDTWDQGIKVDADSIFEVWSSGTTLGEMLGNKTRAISAFGWYLDVQQPMPTPTYEWINTWQLMWEYDPFKSANVSPDLEQYFLGGEAAMWGEAVSQVNIDSRVWPRACGVAERLWSPAEINGAYIMDAEYRLIEHRCRLAQRGIGAGPIFPDICPLPWEFNITSVESQIDKPLAYWESLSGPKSRDVCF